MAGWNCNLQECKICWIIFIFLQLLNFKDAQIDDGHGLVTYELNEKTYQAYPTCRSIFLNQHQLCQTKTFGESDAWRTSLSRSTSYRLHIRILQRLLTWLTPYVPPIFSILDWARHSHYSEQSLSTEDGAKPFLLFKLNYLL